MSDAGLKSAVPPLTNPPFVVLVAAAGSGTVCRNKIKTSVATYWVNI